MKKNIIYIIQICLLMVGVLGFAQNECEQKIEKAKKVLKGNKPFKDLSKLFESLLPCADAGLSEAQHYIGLMYTNGIGTEKDDIKGFRYTELAAHQNHAIAQLNLAMMYKIGEGCRLNVDKVIEWLEKSQSNGNDRAAYMLGYMYYKGLGVNQSYTEAVSWFKKSNYPMAKHFLGIMYHMGYGVRKNTDKALEYLFSNQTVNSKTFLKYIARNKQEKDQEALSTAIIEAEVKDHISSEAIAEIQTQLENSPEKLSSTDVLGDWTGKLIEYEESGEIIERVTPISINFTTDDIGDLKAKIVIEGTEIENYVLFEDNNMYIPDFKFSLPKLYTSNPEELELEYLVLGMDFSKENVNRQNFLIAHVNSYIDAWKEPSAPKSLILSPKGDNIEEDEELALALASQKNEFIKLYPVPFVNQLYVGFYVKQAAHVEVEINSINGLDKMMIQSLKSVQAGAQSFSVDASHLRNGFYIVKVRIDNHTYTRIVVKS